jgi:hypothetical protein
MTNHVLSCFNSNRALKGPTKDGIVHMRHVYAIVACAFLMLTFCSASQASPIEITSGILGGYAFHDLAFTILGRNGVSVYGFESFPLDIGTELATGHLSELISSTTFTPSNPVFMNFELSFDPITLLTMSPILHAGESASRRFTMTGVLSGPNIQTLDFIGQGTLTTGYFSANDPNGNQYLPHFTAVFDTPEPSTAVMLTLSLIAIPVLRRLIQSQDN